MAIPNKKSKKERLATPGVLTSSTVLNVGEMFVVLRYAGNVNEGSWERCFAQIVEVRSVDDLQIFDNYNNKYELCLINSDVDPDVRKVCIDLVNQVVNAEIDDVSREEAKKMYYVHYDGMDRRLDEWVDRSRIIERANPAIHGSSLATVAPNAPESGTMTRSQRRIHEEFNHVQKSFDDMDATTAKLEKEHAEMTKVKNIERIRYGDYEINVWYASPYPYEYSKATMLYICEYCFAYMRTEAEYCCHVLHYCDRRQPPGDEIYRDGDLSVYEVDGKLNKVYCQCLCLLSKLFLDHKTLFFDVETFIFYVLCEVDHLGAHAVGHFSKERLSANNLACIMVLPPFQRRGYGKLLIQLSYELSNREGVIGTPEKPLSDLGKVSYRGYWWWVLLETLDRLNIEDVTVADLSGACGIAPDDIVSTLQTMQFIKYWKGDYVVSISRRLLEHCKSINMGRTPKLILNPALLKWWPKKKSSSQFQGLRQRAVE